MANTTTTVVNSQLTVSEILAQYLGVKINPHRMGKKQVVLCLWLDDHHSSLSVDNDKGVWNRLGACHKGADIFTHLKMAGVLPVSVDFRRDNWGQTMAKAYLEVDDVKQLERAATCLRDGLLVRILFHLGCRISETILPTASGCSRSTLVMSALPR